MGQIKEQLKHGRGVGGRAQDISTDLEYIVAYYVLAVAQIGMEVTDTVLTIGGHAQNPVLLFLNYLSP
jgi:hypothetical protein